MLAGLTAGWAAGFILGFLGAGGTVVGLPLLLVFSPSLGPHVILGTNAMGVSAIAIGLLAWRLYRREVRIPEAISFAIPGLIGIFIGVHLGLVFPGQRLIFLLSFVLVLVAVWMFYLSTQPTTSSTRAPDSSTIATTLPSPDHNRLIRMVPAAFIIGVAAGFFAIGGGFMIVPGLILAGGLTLSEAAAASLLPIAAFSGLVGIEYLAAGSVDLSTSGFMLGSGIFGGLIGVWLATRLPKKIMQRVFALSLVLIGAYMAFH